MNVTRLDSSASINEDLTMHEEVTQDGTTFITDSAHVNSTVINTEYERRSRQLSQEKRRDGKCFITFFVSVLLFLFVGSLAFIAYDEVENSKEHVT